jgi:hypothetical protein
MPASLPLGAMQPSRTPLPQFDAPHPHLAPSQPCAAHRSLQWYAFSGKAYSTGQQASSLALRREKSRDVPFRLHQPPECRRERQILISNPPPRYLPPTGHDIVLCLSQLPPWWAQWEVNAVQDILLPHLYNCHLAVARPFLRPSFTRLPDLRPRLYRPCPTHTCHPLPSRNATVPTPHTVPTPSSSSPPLAPALFPT